MIDTNLPPALQLFPHKELRTYQTKFLRFVEKNPKAMIHAPVGFGKTIMALIHALPLVRSKNYQLFIFVRTKTQVFRVFLEEIFKIANSKKYGYLTVLPLILKADLCIKRDEIPQFYHNICQQIRCPFLEQAKSVPEEDFPAIVEQIPITAHEGSITIDTFKEAFREFGCPYHIIKRCIPYSNIVVTTQTYLRSKNLQDMFSQLISQSSFPHQMAIIDEGHNFTADFEAEITLHELNKAQAIIPLKVIDSLQELILSQNGRVERPRNLSAASLDAFLDHEYNLTLVEKATLLKVKDFLISRGDIWVSEKKNKLIQLNPYPHQAFNFINNFFDRVLLMSGTFTPLALYKALFDVNYATLQIPSDFQFSLNGILYQRNFTSKFSERSVRTYETMAAVIERLHSSNPFHTIVFTTSHEFKQKLLAHISLPDVYIENPGTTPFFLDELRQKNHECIFGVIGGRLSEGIEILDSKTKRSLLSLIIIAGLPYPRPDASNQLLRSLYLKRWGYRMAKLLSMLPVTRGISQAIGRGIRSESDFAASLILDYRAIKMRPLLPPTHVYRNLQTLYNAYDLFFAKMNRVFKLQ
ncbi:MAG: PhoH family protein [Candidatus Heimdallarchaeota archaeon]|nr:MAG: PhoH family protein [Candidatus Heimdallarchaeota archaeon]